MTCRACEARDALADAFRKDPYADSDGVFFVVEEGSLDPAEKRRQMEMWAAQMDTASRATRRDDEGMISA